MILQSFKVENDEVTYKVSRGTDQGHEVATVECAEAPHPEFYAAWDRLKDVIDWSLGIAYGWADAVTCMQIDLSANKEGERSIAIKASRACSLGKTFSFTTPRYLIDGASELPQSAWDIVDGAIKACADYIKGNRAQSLLPMDSEDSEEVEVS